MKGQVRWVPMMRTLYVRCPSCSRLIAITKASAVLRWHKTPAGDPCAASSLSIETIGRMGTAG